jgi:hypothetical protein
MGWRPKFRDVYILCCLISIFACHFWNIFYKPPLDTLRVTSYGRVEINALISTVSRPAPAESRCNPLLVDLCLPACPFNFAASDVGLARLFDITLSSVVSFINWTTCRYLWFWIILIKLNIVKTFRNYFILVCCWELLYINSPPGNTLY